MRPEGALPDGWIWAKFPELGELARGKSKHRPRNDPRLFDGEYPFIQTGEVARSTGRITSAARHYSEFGLIQSRLFPRGTVCITIAANIADTAILDIEACFPDSIVGVICHEDVTAPEFVEFFMRTARDDLAQFAPATAQKNINLAILQEVRVPLPPLPEQRRIVAKIEALQERSRRARQALEAIPPLLDKFRQSVLAAAFRGDLTADWRAKHPNIEPASALLARIRSERRRRWEETELAKLKAKGKPPKNDNWKQKYQEPDPVDSSNLPELPEGWCWARWAEVGFCQNGRPFPSNEYADAGVRLLRPGNLHVSGAVEWTAKNTRHMPAEWAENHPTHIVGPRELVINLTAQSLRDEFLGRVCLTSEGERCLLNQRIARLTPVALAPKYCLWLFKSRVFRAYVESGLNTGSLIQHMFTSQVDEFVFPLSPLEEQAAIVVTLDEVMRRIADLAALTETSGKRVPRLSRAVLAKAFRGELVPQDPTDEPASALLDRIRSQREATAPTKKTRRPRTKR